MYFTIGNRTDPPTCSLFLKVDVSGQVRNGPRPFPKSTVSNFQASREETRSSLSPSDTVLLPSRCSQRDPCPPSSCFDNLTYTHTRARAYTVSLIYRYKFIRLRQNDLMYYEKYTEPIYGRFEPNVRPTQGD